MERSLRSENSAAWCQHIASRSQVRR